MNMTRKNCITCKWPFGTYGKVPLQMVFCLGLACTGCVCAAAPEYTDTYGHLQPWSPTSLVITEAVRSAKEFCLTKYPSVGFSADNNSNDEIEVTVSSSYISYRLNSTDQTQKGSFADRYSMLKLRIGTFVEHNAGGKLRFIAVQHFLKDSYKEFSTSFTPFTIYYNADTGKTARNTVNTWSTGGREFDFPTMIYSPGPPFFLPGGALGNILIEISPSENRDVLGAEGALKSTNELIQPSGVENGTGAGSD